MPLRRTTYMLCSLWAAILVGCQQQQSPGPQLARTEGERLQLQGQMIERQGKMMTQGERLVAQGQGLRSEGETLKQQGRVLEGERRIAAGEAKIREGEAVIARAKAMPTDPMMRTDRAETFSRERGTDLNRAETAADASPTTRPAR